jgi:hypothetical protein
MDDNALQLVAHIGRQGLGRLYDDPNHGPLTMPDFIIPCDENHDELFEVFIRFFCNAYRNHPVWLLMV